MTSLVPLPLPLPFLLLLLLLLLLGAATAEEVQSRLSPVEARSGSRVLFLALFTYLHRFTY